MLVCVYGNRAYEDTLVELEDIAAGCGFQVIGAVAAVAEHSIMHQYATGRPDGADVESLRGFGEKIWEKLACSEDRGTVDGGEALEDRRPLYCCQGRRTHGVCRSPPHPGQPLPTKAGGSPSWYPRPVGNVSSAACALRSARPGRRSGRV